MSTTNATRLIDLSQRTLFHFASVYQRINSVRSLRHLGPEIQQALDSFEVFKNELITAIERHPTADASDVLKRVFDIEQSPSGLT